MTTPTKEQLLALALRVEQATGPDRHLGREALLSCGKGYVSPLQRWLDPTASLDAATGLFPPDTMYRSGHSALSRDPSMFFCDAVPPSGEAVHALAETEPLARTAAALRALAHALEVK